MKSSIKCITIATIVNLFACGQIKTGESSSESIAEARKEEVASADSEALAETSEKAEGQSGSKQVEAGLITAGEWNDITNFKFWNNLLQHQEFGKTITHWDINTSKPLLIEIKNAANSPIANINVALQNGNKDLFLAKTDNEGKAVLWINPLQEKDFPPKESLRININAGEKIIDKFSTDAPTQITLNSSSTNQDIEIAFMVDATGSMGDEMEFLKVELLDVIKKIQQSRPKSNIKTGTVFYRDTEDEYLTKSSPFTNNHDETLEFIKAQNADGGGDFPEAVHTALAESVEKLQWNTSSKTKLLFVLLDAPPHHDIEVIKSIQQSILLAAKKGIKIIPITASGIDKETEFLMRQMAQLTNGTYIFITDHSGIGDSHLEPTIGDYQVEKLNKLLERIILKYSA